MFCNLPSYSKFNSKVNGYYLKQDGSKDRSKYEEKNRILFFYNKSKLNKSAKLDIDRRPFFMKWRGRGLDI